MEKRTANHRLDADAKKRGSVQVVTEGRPHMGLKQDDMFDGLVVAATDINDLYMKTLEAVLRCGATAAPRGLPTREVRHAILQLRNPRQRLVTVRARKTNAAFAITEWLFTMIGTRDGAIPLHYNRKIEFLVKSPPATFEYSYGSRLRNWNGIDQLHSLRDRLSRDNHTRRAAAVLLDPVTDHLSEENVPCITCIQFLLRDGCLDLTVYMRSNDLILGFVYDAFTFTLILEVMAGWLRVDTGTYTHIAESLHIYERDVPFAREILANHEGVDLYSGTTIPDIRLSCEEFNPAFRRLAEVEEFSRRDPHGAAEKAQGLCTALPSSWRGMAYCILAYNVHRCTSASTEVRSEQFRELVTLTDPHYAYMLRSRYGAEHGMAL